MQVNVVEERGQPGLRNILYLYILPSISHAVNVCYTTIYCIFKHCAKHVISLYIYTDYSSNFIGSFQFCQCFLMLESTRLPEE